jgi:hypothetical protein
MKNIRRTGGGVYRLSVGKHKAKRPLATPRRTCQDNIKMDFKKPFTNCGMDYFNSG